LTVPQTRWFVWIRSGCSLCA